MSKTCLTPCALLVIVALAQIWEAKTHNLSPWKGGGFGMFSCIDSPGERFLSLIGECPNGALVRVRRVSDASTSMPSLTPGDLKCLTTNPTRIGLNSLARAMTEIQYVDMETERNYLRSMYFKENPNARDPFIKTELRKDIIDVCPQRSDGVGHKSAKRRRLTRATAVIWHTQFAADRSTVSVCEMMRSTVNGPTNLE